ncbi:hypothetical protein [Croceivirga sp. JEA036]|uniref:hypothetical protein n=1 Tax=Croceivirga sp. JEA036 TaxID=2721162 RepID=UPI00143A5FBB|nr:hypothetical protein [Croceivirga sp. JEA036]NJB37788.1 hypothetical protein [Croceivirga sp. JEA036]
MKNIVIILSFTIPLIISCSGEQEKHMSAKDIDSVHKFVSELNTSLNSFNYSFIKQHWNHSAFKSRIGKLDNTGKGVYNHIYETQLKSNIVNANLNLINLVKHHNAKLLHLNTNIVADYAETTYLILKNDNTFNITKYRIDVKNGTLTLTDFFNFREDQWFSETMREVLLLNLKHTTASRYRLEANQAYSNYIQAQQEQDFELAYNYLEQIPETHRILNDYKIAKLLTASNINDSVLQHSINQVNDTVNGNTIYIDYLLSNYHTDTDFKEEVQARMRKELGINKKLLDSLTQANTIWW